MKSTFPALNNASPLRSVVFILALTFLAAGCTEGLINVTVIEDVAEGRVLKVSAGQAARVVKFQKLIIKVHPEERIGVLSYSARGSFDCGDGSVPILRRGTDGFFQSGLIPVSFGETLKKAGYKVVGDSDRIFERSADGVAEFLVGGKVTSIKLDMCRRLSSFRWAKALFEIKWQVYSQIERRVVLEVTTKGGASGDNERIKIVNDEVVQVSDGIKSVREILLGAFQMATRNLLANARFHRLVTTGKASPSARPPATVTRAMRTVRIRLAPRARGRLTDSIERAQSAVVTIRYGKITGSGFYISRKGYVLTNAHVVKGARSVKVRLKDGRELTGNVVAIDSDRDVALIKTGAVKLSPLPLLPKMPRVGTNVYVIGSPLGESFASTLSRGIVSGKRKRRGRNFIQSDADVLPGSSGGPMLDSAGNVIGIAVSGVVVRGAPTRLNFFIPVGEAIQALNGKIKGRSLTLRINASPLPAVSVAAMPPAAPTAPAARPKPPPVIAAQPKLPPAPAAPSKPPPAIAAKPPSAPAPKQSASRTPVAIPSVPINFLTVPDGRLTSREIKVLIGLREFSVLSESRVDPFNRLNFATRGSYTVEETVRAQIVERGRWSIKKKNLLCMQRTDVGGRERCYEAAKQGSNLILRQRTGGGGELVLYGER